MRPSLVLTATMSLFLGVSFLAESAYAEDAANDLVVSVSPQVALPGQTVTVTLKNVSAADTYTLSTACLFNSVHLNSCDTDPVAVSGCLQVLTPIAPGQSYSQPWDQKDDLGQQVADGGYRFAISIAAPSGAKADLCPLVQVGVSCTTPPDAYGSGGAGTGGAVPAISSAGGYPAIGSTAFQVWVTNGLGGAPMVMFIGFQPSALQANWGTFLIDPTSPIFQVPLVLQGAPGVPGTGFAALGVPLPNNTVLLGLEVYFQGLIGDPGSTGGVAHTEGLHVAICQ